MYLLLLWLTKIIQKLSRAVGNSGAALPGLIVERLYPRFLAVALRKLPEGVVVVSGTNGKTTTTKIVADSLQNLGDRVMTNRTGSNMTRGLVSLIVSKSRLSGRLPFDVAILEVDEAYAAKLSDLVPIRGALVLNVMRDQLDRFGEIDKTARFLSKLTAAASSFVVLNASDGRVSLMKSKKRVQKIFFAPNPELSSGLKTEDEWHNDQPTEKQHLLNADYLLEMSEGSSLSILTKNLLLTGNVQFEGIHNHLNVVAALALLHQIKPSIPDEKLFRTISEVHPAFGRGEKVEVGNSHVTLLLVKNPSSFVQTLESTDISTYETTSIVINDAYADSRDVSWLWDVDVKKFSASKKLYTSGRRGYDMAVRLKYDGSLIEKVISEPRDLISELVSQQGNHAVFCTYTAMLALRRQLIRMGHLEQIV